MNLRIIEFVTSLLETHSFTVFRLLSDSPTLRLSLSLIHSVQSNNSDILVGKFSDQMFNGIEYLNGPKCMKIRIMYELYSGFDLIWHNIYEFRDRHSRTEAMPSERKWRTIASER